MRKRFYIPETLYNELVNAARAKHMHLKKYIDDLALYLLLGDFDP